MSYLPPPPPNGAPYTVPPPPQYGQPYQPYPPQPGHGQQPLPPPPGQQHGYRPPPPLNSHQHTGHDRQQKPKMVVTRYGRPPHRQQNSWPPPPAQGALPPPPTGPYVQPPTWGQPPPPQGVAPAPYPPPPAGYSHHAPPLPNQYPAHVPGYGPPAAPIYPPPPSQQQQVYPPPPAQIYPQPPAQSMACPPPPPPSAPVPQWSVAPVYPPQVAYSPVPAHATHQAPPAPHTPAQNMAIAPPPQSTPGPPEIIKDLDDPTFYEGWDEGEFEYAMALWIPIKGDTSHDTWSLGQYIWRGAQQITHAISPKLDDPVEVATIEQKYDPNHFVVSSKYYDTEDAEGHEYIFNFQRIRHIDEWKEKKNDPLYKVFTHAELHEDVVPADEVFHQCLHRPREDAVDMAAFLEASLTGYFNGTKGGSGKNLEAENLLASLGVSGTAKPVFATPFPAYAPPPGESPAPKPSAPVTKQKPSTPAPLRNNGFNPFKVASNALLQPTSHTSGLGSQRPNSVVPSPQPRFSPSITQTPHVSPARYSPLHLPSPSTQTGASRTISGGSRTISPLPPPPMHSSLHHGSHPQHPLAKEFRNQDDRQRPHAAPRESDMRSPQDSMYKDPWRRDNNGHRENMITSGRRTPAGPDIGDISANANGPDSTQDVPKDFYEPSNKKRRADEPDDKQWKRNKPKPPADSAYARRW